MQAVVFFLRIVGLQAISYPQLNSVALHDSVALHAVLVVTF
jgi:hypothetical protein